MKTNVLKIMITTIAFVGIGLYAMVAQAETYLYVDASGQVRTVVADTASQALNNAVNIHPNSGVLLSDSSSVPENNDSNSDGKTYLYVDASGQVRTVVADNAIEALNSAINIHPNSGVMINE